MLILLTAGPKKSSSSSDRKSSSSRQSSKKKKATPEDLEKYLARKLGGKSILPPIKLPDVTAYINKVNT